MSVEWATVHEVEGDAEDGFVVRVQRRGAVKPQYSVQIGFRRRDEPERLGVHLRVRLTGTNGTTAVDRSVEGLLKAAYDWVEQDVRRFHTAGAVDSKTRGRR